MSAWTPAPASVALAAVVLLGLARPGAATVWDEVLRGGGSAYDLLMLEAGGAASTDAALDAFDRAAALDPTRVAAHALAMQRLVIDRRYEEVLARASALAGTPSGASPEVAFFQAIALAATGDFASGAGLLERASRYQPELVDRKRYLANLGELLVAIGAFDRAIFFYREALNPGSPGVADLGLAAALTLSGRHDEARGVVTNAVAAGTPLEELEEPGALFVPDGMDDLYRALVHDVLGSASSAEAHRAAFLASAASALVSDAVRGHLEAQPSATAVEARRVALEACTVVQAALSPDHGALAVHCEQGTIQLVDLTTTPPAVVASPARFDDTSAYYIVDVGFGAGGTLRVLYSDGGVEELTWDGATLARSPRHTYGAVDFAPARFSGPSAGRVVFCGNSAAGFQIESWDAVAPPPRLTYLTTVPWMCASRVSDDEQTVAGHDGASIFILSGPGFATPTRISASAPTPSRFAAWDLSRSGDSVAVAVPGRVVVRDAHTGAPTDLFGLPPLEDVEGDPYTGIAALEWEAPDMFVLGTSGGAWIVTRTTGHTPAP